MITLSRRTVRLALALAVVLAVLAPVAVIAAGGTFTDDDSSIFEQDIEWMAANGITSGCGPDMYCPEDNVTRGQMAAFMKRLATKQVVDAGTLAGQPPSDFAASSHSHSASALTNEPGIAVDTPANFNNLTGIGQYDQIGRVGIDTPGAGYVVVQATGYVNVSHVSGTDDNIALNLSDSATATNLFYEGASSFLIASGEPTASNYRFPFTTQSVYEVTGAETLIVYLYANQFSGALPTVTSVAHPQIIAVYYPTAYGTVELAGISPADTSDGFGN